MSADNNPRTELIWNLATVFVLALIPMILAIGLSIFFEPQSSMNPLPPPTMPARLVIPTSTPTPLSMPPTWTPTSTDQPLSSPTQEAQASATPEFEVISGTPIASLDNPEPTATTANGYFSFGVEGAPQPISASLYDSSRGCTWMGVAGRVFDMQGRPVKGIRVALYGYLNGKSVSLLSLTGTAVQYGLSGYEFTLADSLVASKDALYVRLLDQSDLALSDKVYFDTFTDCNKNLILIDFQQVR